MKTRKIFGGLLISIVGGFMIPETMKWAWKRFLDTIYDASPGREFPMPQIDWTTVAGVIVILTGLFVAFAPVPISSFGRFKAPWKSAHRSDTSPYWRLVYDICHDPMWGPDTGDDFAFSKAALSINQFAAEGRITVYGVSNRGENRQAIPLEFWIDHGIQETSLMGEADDIETSCLVITADDRHFFDLAIKSADYDVIKAAAAR